MPNPSPVTILVAHGSRNPDAAAAHEALCAAVARTASTEGHDVVVVPAYLEIAEPSIPATIDRVIGDGATRVTLLPHFLGPGNHVQRDLPAIVAEACERHPEVAIELAPHLGADPRLVDLLADLVVTAPAE